MYLETKCVNPLCKKWFNPKDGRQKYHNAKCQQDYNNWRAKVQRDIMKPMTRKLTNNRRILKRILGKDKQKVVSKEYLAGAGFDFMVGTRKIKDEGVEYSCIYEYIYVPINEIEYKIRKNHDAISNY